MMKTTGILKIVNVLMMIAMALYWARVLTGIIEIQDEVPGFRNWAMSFPAASALILASLALSLSRDPKVQNFFSIVAGACLVYLGVYGLSYTFVTGLFSFSNAHALSEIARKILFVAVGGANLVVAWKYSSSFGKVS